MTLTSTACYQAIPHQYTKYQYWLCVYAYGNTPCSNLVSKENLAGSDGSSCRACDAEDAYTREIEKATQVYERHVNEAFARKEMEAREVVEVVSREVERERDRGRGRYVEREKRYHRGGGYGYGEYSRYRGPRTV